MYRNRISETEISEAITEFLKSDKRYQNEKKSALIVHSIRTPKMSFYTSLPISPKDNSNSSESNKRSRKKYLDKDKKRRCTNLEADKLAVGGATDVVSALSGIPVIGGTLAIFSAGSYAVKTALDMKYLEEGCGDINFDELKDMLEEKFSKVHYDLDRNLDAIQKISAVVSKTLLTVEKLRNEIHEEFSNVFKFIKKSRIEPTISQIRSFIHYFDSEKKRIEKLPKDRYIIKLESGILTHLSESRIPKTDSLYSHLYDIINLKYAIPESSTDKVAFNALFTLYHGIQVYVSVMFFILEKYVHLADYYYHRGEIEQFNKYLDSIQTEFHDFKYSLIGSLTSESLIEHVINVFSTVQNQLFVQKRKTLHVSLSKIIRSLQDLEHQLQQTKMPIIKEDPGKLLARPSFENSKLSTPLLRWKDGRRVSYALQFTDNNSYSKIGEWSEPVIIDGRANPTLNIPVDHKRRTRLVFRKFSDSKPELAGVITDKYQTVFRDIDRDLFNSAQMFDENESTSHEILLLENGANINTKFDKGRTAFHAAAQGGNVRLGLLFLKNNSTDINAFDENGFTPLHIATEAGHNRFVQMLLNNNADINIKTTSEKMTALHFAAYKGYKHTIEVLLNNKAVDVNACEVQGFTPLHIAVLGGLPVVNALLSNSNVDVNAKSNVGVTPLHLAVLNNYFDVTKVLLEHSKINVNAKTQGDFSVLHLATMTGNVDIVKYFSKIKNIDVNAKSSGLTPLHFAIQLRKKDIIRELLQFKNIDVNAAGESGITPLHVAVATGETEIVKIIMEKNPLIHSRTKNGFTSFHFSAIQGNLDISDILLQNGARLDDKTYTGLTPLHLAVANGRMETVEYLIDYHGINCNTADSLGLSIIEYAIISDSLEIFKYLFQHEKMNLKTDKDLLQKCIHLAATKGRLEILKYLMVSTKNSYDLEMDFKMSLLKTAALHDHVNVVDYLVNEEHIPVLDIFEAAEKGYVGLIKYLLEEKVIDPEAKCKCKKSEYNNKTIIQVAALNDHVNVVKYLIEEQSVECNDIFHAAENNYVGIVKYFVEEEKLDVNVKNDYGESPLLKAVNNDAMNVIKYLDNKKANFSTTDKHKNSLLHIAVQHGNIKIVKYLVNDKKFDINVLNENKETPLHIATNNINLQMVWYLLRHNANVNALDKNGQTPLHRACVTRHDLTPRLIILLLQKGADTLIRDKNNKIALDYTEPYSSSQIIIQVTNRNNTRRFTREVSSNFDVTSLDNKLEVKSGVGIPHSWINDLAHSMIGLFGVIASSFKAAIDLKEQRQKSRISPNDFNLNSSLMLWDLIFRKITGVKYYSYFDQSNVSEYVQNITVCVMKKFESVLNVCARDSKISIHRLNVNYTKVQEDVTKKILMHESHKVFDVLKMHIENACPGRNAGYPGRLNRNKFDTFKNNFNRQENCFMDCLFQNSNSNQILASNAEMQMEYWNRSTAGLTAYSPRKENLTQRTKLKLK